MIISDLLLGWLHVDGCSLGESGWVNPLIGKQSMQQGNRNRFVYATGA